MTMRRRIRYLAEFVAACIARALIRVLPLRLALLLAHGTANVVWHCMPNRRRIATENILKCQLAASAHAAARIARASFRHFAAFIVESLVAETRVRPDNWQSFIDATNAQDLLALAQTPGQGFILITGHFGNWEVPAQMMSFHKPMVAIARRMNNPYTDRLIQARKRGHRFDLIPKHEVTGAKLMNVIKSGKILTMVIDQHARQRGMRIPFFGRPASTHTAAALMHLRTGVPLIFAACVRLGPMRYKLMATPIVRTPGPRNDAAIEEILRTVNHHLEEVIRANPEQYLWGHRRWRPVEEGLGLPDAPPAPPPD
ncbi:MAG: lysophospholipid acyltransferase family protein [Verrucomicrobia bacterium]|nr:lysophospholipid acyltransferase family protein [Verrucomicrobiota bacterium]